MKKDRMTMSAENRESGQQKVESVERALTILDAFSDGSVRLTLNDIAKRTGLYRSTILRLAASLERFGYLHREADGMFRLGPSLWRLGVLYQNAFNLADYVRPVLQQVVDQTRETAAFYIKEGDRRICLYRHHAPRLLRPHMEEGAELTLKLGASGRILTAFSGEEGEFYEEIRRKGFYISFGERDPETSSIAVPVLGVNRELVGALGIVGARTRFDGEASRRMLDILMSEADHLSRTLGSMRR
jgi:DNA-binding IclR family transcriptional regulator